MPAVEPETLVELSEARAYRSLARSAPAPGAGAPIAAATSLGPAVAVVAPTVTGTLNLNRVIGLGVCEPATEGLLDEIALLYRAHGLAYAIELAPNARPPELAQWLRARRMRRSVPTAMLWRPAQPMLRADSPLAVAQARGDGERSAVAELCCAVFRMPAPARELIAAASPADGWRHWLAYREGQVAAAALSFVAEGVAWLGWDATLPEHRGSGAQSALIACRVDDAARSGCTHVTAETAAHTAARLDPSQRNYEKMGFILAHHRTTYVAIPAAARPAPAAAGA
jgi:GNAT superfamily N-acetyltransferase